MAVTTTNTLVKQKTLTRVTPALILTLAVLSAVAPFATDLYLSAFPAMVTELSTTTTGVQLTLTTFLIGAGAGQLIFGPISDRMGRYVPLIIGLVIYLISSVAAALAPNILVLIIARLIQGLSGAAGMVLGRAIISDLSQGVAAAKALSIMMLVGGIAPILAPFAGSLLAEPIGWRGLLGVVAGLGVVAIILVLLFVRESLPVKDRNRATKTEGKIDKLFSKEYLGYTFAYAFGFATMMAYISASPFVYQDMMGLSEVQYGLMFGLNALALAIVSGLSVKLVDRFGPQRLTRIGLTINLVAVLVLMILACLPVSPIWLALPILVAVSSVGLVLGNATALALEVVPGQAGIASAWLGFFQFVLAGLVSPIVSIAGESTAVPMCMTMVVASLIANFAFLFAVRNRGK